MLLGIVTPTFNRFILLERFVRRLKKQRYQNWVAVIVHDGASEEFEGFIERHCDDTRLSFLQTEHRHRDCGNTPRLVGARRLAAGPNPPDYIVFWDDDNYFQIDAVGSIVRAAEKLGRPDLFLVGMGYQGQVLPPGRIKLAELQPGQVDTANYVVRPELAIEAYAFVTEELSIENSNLLLASDFQAFSFMRNRQKCAPIDNETLIGFHDGLRWKPFIRHILGITPMQIGSRPWVRKLLGNRFSVRAAGGLE